MFPDDSVHDDSVHEECGVFAVSTPHGEGIAQLAFFGLFALQHRGQDAAGIVTMLDTKCFMQKSRGMVRDVFRTRNMRAPDGGCPGYRRIKTYWETKSRNYISRCCL